MPDPIILPPHLRGDSFGPITIGPVSDETPLPYPLDEAEITVTFRLASVTGEVAQVLRSTEGEIEIDDGRIVIKRFRPVKSGKLCWDVQLEWPEEGETITVYQTAAKEDRWDVRLDITRPEGAS